MDLCHPSLTWKPICQSQLLHLIHQITSKVWAPTSGSITYPSPWCYHITQTPLPDIKQKDRRWLLLKALQPLQISWQPCLKNSLNAVSVTHNYLHQPCKKILLALLPTFSLFACRPSIQNWVSRASIFLFLTAWVHNMLECIQYQDEVIINMFLKDWKGTDKNNRTLKWFSSHHTWFTNLLATLYVKG